MTGIAVGDLNGDKKPDLVVSTTGTGAQPTVYLNGATWAPVALGAAANSAAVALADVNGDKQARTWSSRTPPAA